MIGKLQLHDFFGDFMIGGPVGRGRILCEREDRMTCFLLRPFILL